MHDPSLNAAARESLLACLEHLHTQAVQVADAHWAQMLAVERTKSHWSEKSALQLLVHRKANHIQMKWVKTAWMGPKNARKPRLVSIEKPRGAMSYSVAKLTDAAKDWELEMVLRTEKHLTSLRRQATFIVQALEAVRWSTEIESRYPVVLHETEAEPDLSQA